MGLGLGKIFQILEQSIQINKYYNSMNTSQKGQKKNMTKSTAFEVDEEQNYKDIVEKELYNDFKVYQYLHQHPNQGHNMEQYTALLNHMLVHKQEKNKGKQLLKKTTKMLRQNKKQEKQNQAKNWNERSLSNRKFDSYYSEEEFMKIKKQLDAKQESIEERTQHQQEMNRILLREISDKKKSLDLLKGDITHMIARYESISVLENKINKVSLVSENQLKKVSFALSKDKEQVQLRLQMQKRFHNKLKIVQITQSKNLKKVKSNYLQAMNRRKQIFDKLNIIQKECASVQEYSDMLKQKQEKNMRSIALFRLLNFICNSISQVIQLWAKFQRKEETVHTFTAELKRIFGGKIDRSESNVIFTIDDINQVRLYEIVIKIVNEYNRLQSDIYKKKKQYKRLMRTIDDEWVRMNENIKKTQSIIISFKMQQEIQLQNYGIIFFIYFSKFKLLQQNFTVLYKLFDFFNKKTRNFNGIHLINSIYNMQRYLLAFHKDNESNFELDFGIFELVQKNMEGWFNKIRDALKMWMYRVNKFIYELLCRPRTKKQQSAQPNSKQQISSRSNNIQNIQNNERNVHSQSEGKIKQTPEGQNQNYRELAYENRNKSGSKKVQEDLAKRLQTLERIDQTYYSMIKETIHMEKQNTKKNYEFQRNFKRKKYSSQDELLEQKRFQASFSNLFKQKPEDSPRQSIQKFQSLNISSKKSKFYQKSSIHITNPLKRKKFNSLIKQSGYETYKRNISFWQNQKKIKLKKKLQQILERV